jgi:hypothetical protein
MLETYRLPQVCRSGEYNSEGFDRAMDMKLLIWRDAILENWGGVFCWSDSDCVFLCRELEAIGIGELGDCDIACQSDEGTLCTGLCFIRGNDAMLGIVDAALKDGKGNEQERINRLKHMVKWKLLPNSFYNISMPPMERADMVAFHANYIVGVGNKLEAIRKYLPDWEH